MNNARIAITGSKGLLGSTLMRTLPNAVALTADIRDEKILMTEVRALGDISYIVHTAAKTNVAACERDPADAHLVNGVGTQNVVDAAHSIGVRVIYISTVSVFSGDAGNYREADQPDPINVHNTTKVEGERAVTTYDKGTILRLNLVGVHPDGSRGTNFMEWLIDSLKAGKDINAFDDVKINPLSNWTIADMIASMITRGVDERILHIGSSDVRSKADIVEMVARRFPDYRGTITRTSVDSIADGVKRPKEMWLNCDYTKQKLGIMMPTLETEIETIFKHFV